MPSTRSKSASQTPTANSPQPSPAVASFSQYSYAGSSTTTVTPSGSQTVSRTKVVSGRVTKAPIKRSSSKSSLSSKYAPPEKYSHLNGIPDSIDENVICLLVGHNPGVQTAKSGHAYAHPSNLFWKLLHSSGLTDRLCKPEEDQDMPKLYKLGLTNIVSRPTKDTAELSKQEQADGTPILEEKVRKYRPLVVVCVGKSIWEAICKHRRGKVQGKGEFKYGWQPERDNIGKIAGEWEGARMFVATSTSGLAASMSKAEKEEIWKELGDWVKQKREEA